MSTSFHTTTYPTRTIQPFFIPPPEAFKSMAAAAQGLALPRHELEQPTANVIHGVQNETETEGLPARTQTQPGEFPFTFSVPFEGARIKTKTLLTSVTAQKGKELEDNHVFHSYQLARTTRDACAARLNYRRLRVHELQMMLAIEQAEVEQAENALKNAELQLSKPRRSVPARSNYIQAPLTRENLAAATGIPLPPTGFYGETSDMESTVSPSDVASSSQIPCESFPPQSAGPWRYDT